MEVGHNEGDAYHAEHVDREGEHAPHASPRSTLPDKRPHATHASLEELDKELNTDQMSAHKLSCLSSQPEGGGSHYSFGGRRKIRPPFPFFPRSLYLVLHNY